jgi:hypothetical protein
MSVSQMSPHGASRIRHELAQAIAVLVSLGD